MATVGEIIIGARELMPDNPASLLAAPLAAGITLTPGGTGGTLPTGTNYFVFTFYNAAGETLASSEKTVTVAAGQYAAATFTLPSGATGIRAYQGSSTGGETQYFQGTSSPMVILGVGGVASTPPLNNTAFNPDADGAVVGVSTVYRWLNDALGKAALAAGGINDITGVPTINGVGRYTLVNRWVKFTSAWYDGWLMAFLDNGNFFYHNSSTGISWMLSMQQVTTRNVFEVSPQANRTAGAAVTSSAVAVADSVINMSGMSGFVLPLGLAMIGTPPSCEIVTYDRMTSTQLLNCVRGVGGTIPQLWGTQTPVTELNMRLHGARMPVLYPVGSAMATLDIPYNWEENIKMYMLGMFRMAEQEEGKASKLFQEFKAWTVELARQNRQMAGPVQVGVAGGREAWGGGMGGGFLIP
jgi:hypothetical protein